MQTLWQVLDGRRICSGPCHLLCPRSGHVRLCLPDQDSQVRISLDFQASGQFSIEGSSICKWSQSHWRWLWLFNLSKVRLNKSTHVVYWTKVMLNFCFLSYTRAYIHAIHKEPSACHLLTVHNVAFQLRLMRRIRKSIMENNFPKFIADFMLSNFPDKRYPEWAINALTSVGVQLHPTD